MHLRDQILTQNSLWRVLIRNILWLLAMQVVTGLIWNFIGWQNGAFSVVYFIVALVHGLPLPWLLVVIAFRDIPTPLGRLRGFGLFLACWIPLLLSVLGETYQWIFVSGYYSGEMLHDPFVSESWSLASVAVCVQFLLITIIVLFTVLGRYKEENKVA